MGLFDIFSNHKEEYKKRTIKNNTASNPISFKNKNIVYPKNAQEQEIQELYDEIKNYPNSKIGNKYTDNVLKKNRYLQKQISTYIPEKQKYKELEENFNKMLQKGDDIFKKDEW